MISDIPGPGRPPHRSSLQDLFTRHHKTSMGDLYTRSPDIPQLPRSPAVPEPPRKTSMGDPCTGALCKISSQDLYSEPPGKTSMRNPFCSTAIKTAQDQAGDSRMGDYKIGGYDYMCYKWKGTGTNIMQRYSYHSDPFMQIIFSANLTETIVH